MAFAWTKTRGRGGGAGRLHRKSNCFQLLQGGKAAGRSKPLTQQQAAARCQPWCQWCA